MDSPMQEASNFKPERDARCVIEKVLKFSLFQLVAEK